MLARYSVVGERPTPTRSFSSQNEAARLIRECTASVRVVRSGACPNLETRPARRVQPAIAARWFIGRRTTRTTQPDRTFAPAPKCWAVGIARVEGSRLTTHSIQTLAPQDIWISVPAVTWERPRHPDARLPAPSPGAPLLDPRIASPVRRAGGDVGASRFADRHGLHLDGRVKLRAGTVVTPRD